MDNTKKIENLKNSLILKGFILILLLAFYMFYVRGEFEAYNNNKQNLENLFSEYTDFTKNGYTFSDYGQTGFQDAELKTLVESMTENFYTTNFSNNTEESYISFLDAKQIDINKLRTDDDFVEKQAKVAEVIPSYDQGIQNDDIMTGKLMTDLDYINSIEKIIKTFNLSYEGSIGIDSVLPIGEATTNSEKASQDKSESKIYYIPLSLELTGRKADILKFLYYISKVGVIKSISDTNIEFYNDDGNGILAGTYIKGDQITSDYNIFENKLYDISYFKVDKYIDKSINIRDDENKTVEGFVNFIESSEEGSEQYTIEIILNTYVQGLPLYAFQKAVVDFVKDYTLKKSKLTKIETFIKNNNKLILTNNAGSIISMYKVVEQFFEDTKTDFDEIQKKASDYSSIESTYSKISVINEDFSKINKIIDKIEEMETELEKK